MKIINYFFLILILLLLFGCYKPIKFGQTPEKIQESLEYESGIAPFKEERIKLKYVITKWNIKDNPKNDLIFYFHGIGRSELEWVEKDGFGSIYHDLIDKNPHLKSFPVVSISLGATYLFIKDAPSPYNMDLEEFFINKIVPYFKEKLNCNGKIYLIGHSMGGYNALTLSLRHPEIFPVIATISPYVAPISPFGDAFDKKGEELKMPRLQVVILKTLLTNAYKTEENWFKYNPFKLVESNKKNPYIILSTARYDLPGFEWSIINFSNLLKEKGIPHFLCESAGDHRTTCKNVFLHFLEKISE